MNDSDNKDNKSDQDEKDPKSGISFSSFVMSLSMQALMQMGEMPAPDGAPVKKDLHAAQQTIDILSVLRIKTKGNLDSEEERVFQDMLHNVRMAYLRSK